MTSSTSSTFWVTPFFLGAVTSLSAVWVSQNWRQISRFRQVKQKQRSTYRSVESNNRPNNHDDQSQQPVVDAPDLDQRMLRKCEAVLKWRTSRLVLVIERCTNDHNYSAILRTAEALGIQTVFMIDPPSITELDEYGNTLDISAKQGQAQITRTAEELEQRRLHHLFARNATEWLEVRDFETSEDCVTELRKLGYYLWVTDLSQEAEALPMPTATARSDFEIPEKIALVMGTEAVGASQYILDQADKRVYLPLRGFADSLNLSVATALIIHHLFCLDPSLIGAMDEEDRVALRRSWYVKLVQQRLLSSSQKKTRTRLIGQIKKCEMIFEKTQKDPNYKLQPGEKKKLDNWTNFQKEFDEINSLLEPAKVEAAIQEWLDNPPEALTDLRRADTHRVCFVGKNTKDMHKEHWKDMVATSNMSSIYGATAASFREKVHSVSTSQNDTTKSYFIEKHF
ncbi:tRNA/rRNA methyltransferase SpoU [Nitzschia inconspicua]|uniref:tRNA/rRNA methyltransferase SpoU n=1 Tax=Nitzschia inconspicua TaxID=303405 RepID=A0A9K3KDA6_9STRA|nr:tRNA/rRNA methyltransferase SpoU [Nitzschia inconspicua]